MSAVAFSEKDRRFLRHYSGQAPAPAEKAKIRNASEADLPAIIKIYNAAVATRISTAQLEPVTVASRRHWLSEHSPDRYPFWVAEIDRCVCGWLSFKSFLPRCAHRGTIELSGMSMRISGAAGLRKNCLRQRSRARPRLGLTRWWG